MVKLHILFLLIIMVFFSACYKKHVKNTEPENLLIGSWEIKKIRWFSTNQSFEIEQAQPGLFIFDDGHYALMWVPQKEPRKPFTILSKPTDEEILSAFKTVIFNAGTYQMDAAGLRIKAMVAKVPGFEGGQQFFELSHNDEQLVLTMYDEIYPDGTKPEWSGTWQTQFTLVRVTGVY